MNNTICHNSFVYLVKLTKIRAKTTENVNKTTEMRLMSTKIKLLRKRKLKKFLFDILRLTSFLMIQLIALYDEDSDRLKLTKNIWKTYISLPTNKQRYTHKQKNTRTHKKHACTHTYKRTNAHTKNTRTHTHARTHTRWVRNNALPKLR